MCYLKKEKEDPSLPHPMSTELGVGGARASPLGEGVGIEGNGIGIVVHGEKVPNVPGP
jgi:hypothetical protein